MKDSPKQKKKNKSNFFLQHLTIIFFILLAGNILLFAGLLIVGFVLNFINVSVGQNNNKPLSAIKKLLPAASFQDLSVTSRAMVVYDIGSNAVIYGKNQNLRFSPASTAKIMTATLALEYFPLDTVFIVPQNIYTVEGSKMGLYPGESITFENLLYGLLLPSGNDAAYVLASAYPGGKEAFILKMNEKAKDLKLSGTHFIDPAGYEDGNFTTAFDLARLAAYALQNKKFAQVVSTKNIIVENTNGSISHILKNINELLSIPGVNGVKTGFTNEAEGVLVTSFETGDQKYIIVVLRSEDRFGDTEEIIQRILDLLISQK